VSRAELSPIIVVLLSFGRTLDGGVKKDFESVVTPSGA
jgi:hypothetical protein